MKFKDISMENKKKMVTKSLWELQFGYTNTKEYPSKPKAYVKPRTAGAKLNGLSI